MIAEVLLIGFLIFGSIDDIFNKSISILYIRIFLIVGCVIALLTNVINIIIALGLYLIGKSLEKANAWYSGDTDIFSIIPLFLGVNTLWFLLLFPFVGISYIILSSMFINKKKIPFIPAFLISVLLVLLI